MLRLAVIGFGGFEYFRLWGEKVPGFSTTIKLVLSSAPLGVSCIYYNKLIVLAMGQFKVWDCRLMNLTNWLHLKTYNLIQE